MVSGRFWLDSGGFGWIRLGSGGFGWFRVVSGFINDAWLNSLCKIVQKHFMIRFFIAKLEVCKLHSLKI